MMWIAEIVKDYKENPDEFRLNQDCTLAKYHPNGEDEYFKELIFKLYKEAKKTVIGGLWLSAKSISPFRKVEDLYWIESVVQTWMKTSNYQKVPENIKSDVKEFFSIYFYILILKAKVKSLPDDQQNKEIEKYLKYSENPHYLIFKDGTHFELFEHLKESVKSEHADYSFIFRAMHKDKFINNRVKQSEFRDWLAETYDIVIDKLRPYDYCKTPYKVSNYGTSKLLYKL